MEPVTIQPPPLTPTDFNSTTYPTAPSTPRLIISELYQNFDQLLIMDQPTVPFAWEQKPGLPKPIDDQDFAFDHVRAETFCHAEDLFDHGIIKPISQEIRGRETNFSSKSRRTRSLPPFKTLEQQPKMSSSTCTTLSTSGSEKMSKKWSFKDLFLFRSASDGRALDRDPLKKYWGVFRKHDEDLRNSSLRDGSGSKRRRGVSAHELHYTVNRAVSNDMKKKSFLPYKQGILGRLAFNPTVHALSNGFGFSHNN